MTETTDVVIVGSRCAGSAAAIALAGRGRSVIAIDSTTFPSDTLSTHLFFPSHWAELERLGARDRVLALGAPLHTRAGLGTPEVDLVGPFNAYEGITEGSCVRRPGLDAALVETARATGAEVREGIRMTDLLRDEGGRVTGIRWSDRDGDTGEIHARLVIGADGRNSKVAKLAGTTEHHSWDNQRMMAFAYYDDPRTERRDTAMQWRSGEDLVTVFPCDGDQSLILLMPPKDRRAAFRADAEAAFDETIARFPKMQERLEGCTRASKIRISTKHPAYFRHSHGPGWALAGDAGHFKDPVLAQGIRDALRFGRLLGEAVAPALDDPAALDHACGMWEADRDRQCLPTYQWGNLLGRADEISPIESAAYRWFGDQPGGTTQFLDVFCRLRTPQEVFTPGRVARWVARAATDPAVDTRELAGAVGRDARREVDRALEERRFVRRRAASAATPVPRPAEAPAATARVPVAA